MRGSNLNNTHAQTFIVEGKTARAPDDDSLESIFDIILKQDPIVQKREPLKKRPSLAPLVTGKRSKSVMKKEASPKKEFREMTEKEIKLEMLK